LIKVPVLVINLKNDTKRLSLITQRLEDCEIPFTRISGVVGRGLSDSEVYKYYDPSLNRATYRRPLTLGEIGCYLSHIKCWSYIVDNNFPVTLILEDDAEFCENLRDVIVAIQNLDLCFDLIKAGRPPKPKRIIDSKPLNDLYDIVKYRKIPNNAVGYFISLDGARKLITTRHKFGRPVDDDMQFWWEYKGDVMGIDPYPVWPGEQSKLSSIGNRKIAKFKWFLFKGPILRARYECNVLVHRFFDRSYFSKKWRL